MFTSEEVTVWTPFEVAAARLTRLTRGGGLHAPSQTAYDDGLATELRVGPLGSKPGLSRLVRVHWLEPVRRGATMTLPLRWEATGAVGGLFPVLDADLILVRHGDDAVLLGLTGSYRPPLGRPGAALDSAIMHRVATATIQSLLQAVAEEIRDPAAQPDRAGVRPWWQPAPVVDPSG